MLKIDDLTSNHFITCTACMSVWADALSWANANPSKVVKDPSVADNIIILSCQVTDLAILNDLRTAERYQKLYPSVRVFISGCLANRTDIEIPFERLEMFRCNYQEILDRTLVHFEKPFWVEGFEEGGDEYAQGHLFREMYPLRIGKGCPNKCTYCTIRITRGDFECYDAALLEEEFLRHKNVLLVADSPTIAQVKQWCDIALKHNKEFSIRNVEPVVTMACADKLEMVARKGLLKVFHSPVQSGNPEVLKDMGRNAQQTLNCIKFARELRAMGAWVATNVIIDYKGFDQQQELTEIYNAYDYVSWNPLWNNKWDRKKAEERWAHYFGD